MEKLLEQMGKDDTEQEKLEYEEDLNDGWNIQGDPQEIRKESNKDQGQGHGPQQPPAAEVPELQTIPDPSDPLNVTPPNKEPTTTPVNTGAEANAAAQPVEAGTASGKGSEDTQATNTDKSGNKSVITTEENKDKAIVETNGENKVESDESKSTQAQNDTKKTE
jgi:hypothetical protein